MADKNYDNAIKCSKEIDKILKKYNCSIQPQMQLVGINIQPKPTEKEPIDYGKEEPKELPKKK